MYKNKDFSEELKDDMFEITKSFEIIKACNARELYYTNNFFKSIDEFTGLWYQIGKFFTNLFKPFNKNISISNGKEIWFTYYDAVPTRVVICNSYKDKRTMYIEFKSPFFKGIKKIGFRLINGNICKSISKDGKYGIFDAKKNAQKFFECLADNN